MRRTFELKIPIFNFDILFRCRPDFDLESPDLLEAFESIVFWDGTVVRLTEWREPWQG